MTKPFAKDDQIRWKWMGREIAGVIKEIYPEPVTKLIKEKNIKRNGSPENPAYLVESEAGNLALKLHSELIPGAEKKTGGYTGPRPKMFDGKLGRHGKN